MSPGSQMRALTANRARPNSTTIAAGKRVERKNCKGLGTHKPHSGGRAVGKGTAASRQLEGLSSQPVGMVAWVIGSRALGKGRVQAS